MPEKMFAHKRPGGHGKCYTVKNMASGRIHARCATKANAQRQMHILQAVEHNPSWRPTHGGHRKH